MPSTSWQSILVAVRAPGARKQLAIGKAARLAERSGARLTLLHAFAAPYPLPDPMPTDPARILDLVAAQHRAALLDLARPLRKAGLKVQCDAVWDFPPAQAIVRRVLRDKPDLVVAESHRHSRLARWFLASADWDLIRECPCPVWFVKNARMARKPLILTAIDPTHAHAKPAGLDERLVQAAESVMRQLDGRIALLHVEDTTQAPPPALMSLPGLARRRAAGAAAAQAAINRLGRRHGVPAAARLVRPGVPAAVLTASAAELKADVLVMGAVSRSGLSHSFIGNTAEAVIDGVSCDVLVVKPRRFRTAVPRKGPQLPGVRR